MSDSVIQTAIEHQDPALARQALEEISALLDTTTAPEQRVYLLFSKSSCYGILGRFEEAREQLIVALQQDPDDPQTRFTFDFTKGVLYQQEGRHIEAFATLTAVLSAHAQVLNRPEMRTLYEDIQQRRAFLLVHLRRFQDAIPILEEILAFQLTEGIRSDALASLGLCYLEVHEYETARQCFLQAIRFGLTSGWEGQVHFYLGISSFYAGSFQEAKRQFQICAEHTDKYRLPVLDLYQWLYETCRCLGETRESERYAQLAKLS